MQEVFLSNAEACVFIQGLDDAGLTNFLFSFERRTDLTMHVYDCKPCWDKVWVKVREKWDELCKTLQAMTPENAVDYTESEICPPALTLHNIHCEVCGPRLEAAHNVQLDKQFANASPREKRMMMKLAAELSSDAEQGKRDAEEIDKILSQPGMADELLRILDEFLPKMASRKDTHPALRFFIAVASAPRSMRHVMMLTHCKPESREFWQKFEQRAQQFGNLFNAEGSAQ